MVFSVKRARYRGVITRLFDYGELAEVTFKLAVYSALALYIILVTGLLAPSFTAPPVLGILTLRVAFTTLLLAVSVYVVREFRSTKTRTERKKVVSQKGIRETLYSLIALLITAVAFYALLLYY